MKWYIAYLVLGLAFAPIVGRILHTMQQDYMLEYEPEELEDETQAQD